MLESFALWQWGVLIGSSIFLFFLSPLTKTAEGFFGGKNKQNIEPSLIVLTFSLVISWIFAKSVFNAASLGQSFGLLGGLAYAAYYLSFFVAGWILVEMRMRGKFESIHHFLRSRFGKGAVILFSLLIAFRLFNEVWSNSAVIGKFFGETNSLEYIIAILSITFFTLLYALRGGLRSSLWTDFIQMILFSVFLGIVLVMLIPGTEGGLFTYWQSGEWSMAMGGNLLVVALLQIFSYPFHDPVMTDRAFIADPKKTRKSFFIAGILGFILITLFSFLGIYSAQNGFSGLPQMIQSGGLAMLVFVNILFITSAASTLDSTFSSSSKLVVLDLLQQKIPSVNTGRVVMIVVAVLGSLPLLLTDEIIKATTVSGTMAIGLAPIFLCWRLNAPKISFYLSVGIGILAGIILTMGLVPQEIYLTTGKYADLLVVNIYGIITCFIGFLVPWAIKKAMNKNS